MLPGDESSWINIAPRAGAWIESVFDDEVDTMITSLPVRERGLKVVHLEEARVVVESLPVRERGLKVAGSRSVIPRLLSLPVRERGLKDTITSSYQP